MWKLNTNCAADELRADATSPPLALCPRSAGFVARGAVAGPLGRAPTHREALHLWARTPQTNPKGQTARGRAKAGVPGLTRPGAVLNSSVTPAYAAHCSHLGCDSGDGRLWGGTHRVTSGHGRRSVRLGDWAGQEEPRSASPSPARKASGGRRRSYSERCPMYFRTPGPFPRRGG